jgi:hypothetical protein
MVGILVFARIFVPSANWIPLLAESLEGASPLAPRIEPVCCLLNNYN